MERRVQARGRIGWGAHPVALALTVALFALSVPSAAQAETNISGTWNCCGAGGAGAQNFAITDHGGSLSGKGLEPSGASFAVITGSVSGDNVSITTTYEASFDAGYVATFVGTIAADGQTMSGSWTSNVGQSGTWTATLEAGTGPSSSEPSTKSGGKAPSFTAVQCTISKVAPDTSTCTAQVAGYGAKSLVSPTGTVSFTATSGTVGTSCTLAATPGSPGISSCTVSYLPSATLKDGEPPPVTASYSGDATYKSSTGASSYVPHSVVLLEDGDIGEASEVPDGGTSEGIPVALTNTNPFTVSADEYLTVSGYPPVANTSSASSARAVRTQVIGRASYKIGPARTIASKVKLSAGGARLLRKHKHLQATLIVVTKHGGKRARVTHTLVIKV